MQSELSLLELIISAGGVSAAYISFFIKLLNIRLVVSCGFGIEFKILSRFFLFNAVLFILLIQIVDSEFIPYPIELLIVNVHGIFCLPIGLLLQPLAEWPC